MALFRSGIDLLATIIIPASLLAYWNFNTQRILKRRARIIFRSRASRNENLVNATNQQQAAQMLNNNDQNNDLEQDSANNGAIAQNTVGNQHAEGKTQHVPWKRYILCTYRLSCFESDRKVLISTF